jgi:hypothetical protein
MEMMGQWHDYQISIRQLKKTSRNCSNAKEMELLENIKTLFISKRKALFDQINAALRHQNLF